MAESLPSIPETIRALETLLARKRRAGAELLSLDGYERWGAQHDTPEGRAEKEAEGARAFGERMRAADELTLLVERLRREDPAAIERWAAAHEELLHAFVERCGPTEPSSHEAIGVSVASDELREWALVKRGEKPFVEENVYYVAIDREHYRSLFGIDA